MESTVETPYRTRSSLKKKQVHKGRLSRTVSMDISYDLGDTSSSENDKSPTHKKHKDARPKCEPSSTRIKADSFITKPPVTTPLQRSTRRTMPISHPDLAAPVQADAPKGEIPLQSKPDTKSSMNNSASNTKIVVKGNFKMEQFGIKRRKKPRKFGCKMCTTTCNSIHELTIHHQQIIYCTVTPVPKPSTIQPP